MEKSFGLFFFLRKNKNEKGLERMYYMRLTADSEVSKSAPNENVKEINGTTKPAEC